jgi:hypothetical protein
MSIRKTAVREKKANETNDVTEARETEDANDSNRPSALLPMLSACSAL